MVYLFSRIKGQIICVIHTYLPQDSLSASLMQEHYVFFTVENMKNITYLTLKNLTGNNVKRRLKSTYHIKLLIIKTPSSFGPVISVSSCRLVLNKWLRWDTRHAWWMPGRFKTGSEKCESRIPNARNNDDSVHENTVLRRINKWK